LALELQRIRRARQVIELNAQKRAKLLRFITTGCCGVDDENARGDLRLLYCLASCALHEGHSNIYPRIAGLSPDLLHF
jgi:hypothetical protein